MECGLELIKKEYLNSPDNKGLGHNCSLALKYELDKKINLLNFK